MASLALTSLITDFFYTGPSAFGKLFPEVFAQEALKSIVCDTGKHLFLLTKDTGVQQDHSFDYAMYLKIFSQFMGMQAKIDDNAKHAAMTWALRIHWATAGR